MAPSLIRVLYDSRYHAAGWMTQLLCIGIWFALLQRSSQPCIMATDRMRALATSNGANIIVTLIAAPCGFYLAGIGGFIAGWALGNLMALIVLQFELEDHGIPIRRQDVLLTMYFAMLCLSGEILRRILVSQLGPDAPSWQPDGLATLCIGLVGSLVLFRSLKGSLRPRARLDALAG
jgi:O-antigen/teichoic acid export membrane protein